MADYTSQEHTDAPHDCMRDTDVYQSVMSPGNTRADRDDIRACQEEKDILNAPLPSAERLASRPMSMGPSLFGMAVISRSRSPRSRR